MQEKNIDSSEILAISIPAACRRLGVSTPTGYLMAKTGQLKVIRCGQRRLVVPLEALRKMLEGDDGSRPQQK